MCFEFSESRTLAGVIWPTFGHQTVEGGRTLGRHRQALPVFYPANHVIVFHPLEGLDAVHQDLPHAYTYGGDADTQKSPTVMNHIITQWRWIRKKKKLTEHPDVTCRRESPKIDRFRSHPLNGKFTFRSWDTNTDTEISTKAENRKIYHQLVFQQKGCNELVTQRTADITWCHQ